MAYKDLRDFINKLDENKMIKYIDAEVDAELEITEITDRISKANGPALLFQNVKNSKYPVLINTFGSYDRLNLALQVNNLDDIAEKISDFMEMSHYIGLINKVKSVPKLAKLALIFPRKVDKAACQEIIEEDPDLSTLPILKCWPEDGGKFITLPLVITRDPETGMQNMGMYRLQVYDNKTTGMHWHLHKDGREIYDKYMINIKNLVEECLYLLHLEAILQLFILQLHLFLR